MLQINCLYPTNVEQVKDVTLLPEKVLPEQIFKQRWNAWLQFLHPLHRHNGLNWITNLEGGETANSYSSFYKPVTLYNTLESIIFLKKATLMPIFFGAVKTTQKKTVIRPIEVGVWESIETV